MRAVCGATIILLCTCSAETLEERLRASKVPTQQFSAEDLKAKLTSYGIPLESPFLLAYYVDNGSGFLEPPLRVIRYDRATGNLRRVDLPDIQASFWPGQPPPMHCLGSILALEFYRGFVYINTHINPSAGCVIILSESLKFKAAESGWTLGFIGAEYAIIKRSEVHFMSVFPLHIGVFDLKRNKATEVYPFPNDPQRRLFSRLIGPHISPKWCAQVAAQCDPQNFNVFASKVIVNEDAHVFGFHAEFNAEGFGDAAVRNVRPRTVSYIFRERNGAWEHREFDERQLQALLGGTSFEDLIGKRPEAAFPAWR